jgi:hypothetical protein
MPQRILLCLSFAPVGIIKPCYTGKCRIGERASEYGVFHNAMLEEGKRRSVIVVESGTEAGWMKSSAFQSYFAESGSISHRRAA